MAVTGNYDALLGVLGNATEWSRQDNYEEFKKYLDDNHSNLREGDGGYEALLRELLEKPVDDTVSEDDRNWLYRQFRIIAMAYEDPDYPGYVRSFNFNDEPVRVLATAWFTADPDALTADPQTGWAKVTEDDGSGEEEPDEQGRRLDKATGLLWDEDNWYTPDRGITVTFEPTGKVFDKATGLLFDAEHWYTPSGVIVYLDSNDPTSAWSYDDNGNWYEHGILSAGTAAAVTSEPVGKLVTDEASGLRYDEENWYLPDEEIVVYLSPDSPGFCYDDAGNWYQQNGKDWKPWASIPPAQSAEPDAADAGASPPEVTPGEAPVTAEVEKSVEKVRELVVEPSVEKILSQLPGELKSRIGLAELEDLVRRSVAEQTAKIAATPTAAQ